MKPPSKIIVHKNSPFNDSEIKGIKQALSSIERLELLYIQKNSPFRAIRLFEKRKPHNYPIKRGIATKLDKNSFVLWTSGSIEVETNQGRLNFYQEGRHIPKPLLVSRYYGHDMMEEVANEILKMTKMNWNNLQYYNKFPVTVDFASKIARISKQSQDTPRLSLPYDFRFYI